MAIDNSMSTNKKRRRLNEYLIKFQKPRATPKDTEAAKQWARSWIKNLSVLADQKKASALDKKKNPKGRGKAK